MAEWRIVNERVEGEETPDQVVLVFELTSQPHYRWKAIFENLSWHTVSSPGHSTMARPQVMGKAIRAVTAPGSRDSTTEWVRSAVDEANRQFQALDPPPAF